jgi:STE24 endopeptidase
VLAAAWPMALLAGAAASGVSRGLCDAGEALARGVSLPDFLVPCFVSAFLGLALFGAYELGATPLAFFGHYAIDRRYGLTGQPVGAWAVSRLKAVVAVGAGIVAGAAIWPVWVGAFGRGWWMTAWLVGVAGAVLVAWVAPVLLLPRLYRLTPLARPSLVARLGDLTTRAGVRLPRVLEWHLGGGTSRARAAMAGIGPTRCVLLSDALLSDYSEDEIEVIVAHELAHDVRGDVWRALAGRGLAMGWALWLAQQALGRLSEPRWHLAPSAPESLPLAALAVLAGMVCGRPVLRAWSRRHERQADHLALELTGQPGAFVTAVQRLSARNLSDEVPPAWVRWLFYEHPPVGERLAMARGWAASSVSVPSPPTPRSSSGNLHHS